MEDSLGYPTLKGVAFMVEEIMRRIILGLLLISLSAPSLAAEMRRALYKKDNLHPCRIKQCSEQEQKKLKKYDILYNQLGKEQKTPALRDRINFNFTYDF